MRFGYLFLSLVLLASLAPAQSQQDSAASARPAPLQVTILNPPAAFRAGGQWHLCYEIFVNNLSFYSWTVQSIQAQGEHGDVLLAVSGKDLEKVLFHSARIPGKNTDPAADIAPGEALVAYLWIDLPNNAAVPSRLQHQFTLKKPGDPTEYHIPAPTTTVSTALPEIVSPLQGKNWAAVNGPSNSSRHRRALIVIDGTPHVSQRYAIDWVQMGDDGQTFSGDAKDNRSYHCFGVEAHAIANGVVVEVKDGIPENTPRTEKLAVPITLETVAGNHVNLDLGGGIYAMYAHLQPGSIRVKVGDKVTPGQVIGLVGNTGNSGEPHLHFQLMNKNSPLASDGIPYSFPSYKLAAKMSGDVDNPKIERLPAPETRNGDIPAENDIVNFEP